MVGEAVLEVTEMIDKGREGRKYLDYAVYGNVIVPLIHFDADAWLRMEEDSEAGRCRFVSRLRSRRR